MLVRENTFVSRIEEKEIKRLPFPRQIKGTEPLQLQGLSKCFGYQYIWLGN